VVHATRNIASSLHNCRKLLKPNGKLFLIETTKDWEFTKFMLGALPGYWLGASDGRPSSPFMSKQVWQERLLDAGFSGADLVLDDYPEPASCTTLIVSRNTGNNTGHAHMNGVNGINGTNGINGVNGINGGKESPITLVRTFFSILNLTSRAIMLIKYVGLPKTPPTLPKSPRGQI